MTGLVLYGGLLAALLALAPSSAPVQQPADRFHTTVAGGALSGTEEFVTERSAHGVHVSGALHTQRRGGLVIDATQDLTLDADWRFLRYRLEAKVDTQVQVVEAWTEGGRVMMRVTAGGQTHHNQSPLAAPAAMLDNLVVSHYQMLLNWLAAQRLDTANVQLVVPQALAVVSGHIAAAGTDEGTLNGHAVRLRHYALEVGSTLVNLWAEAGTSRLMRVAIPLQGVEIARDGFTAAPAAPPPSGPTPYAERVTTFASDGLKIPGTLCLPAGARDAVPLVVLVAGSGPNDRDETIGPNKPFADLAHGLAAAGVATLRYDKRTFAFAQTLDLKMLTVDQEVINDAVAAVGYARGLPGVSPTRVFLLGHSLGGALGPLIAARVSPNLAGLVLMAASGRPLDQLIEEQTAFQMGIAGQSDAAIQHQQRGLQDAFARVRSGTAADSEIVFHAPVRYWRDLFARTPLDTLRTLKIPVLVLQGGKDVQVRKADYDLVVQALADKRPELRAARWFPDLNHLFMPVTGSPTGKEYGIPGHVDAAVIATIAAWVQARH